MPIRILNRPTPSAPSGPSTLQRLLAGGTRVGSGILATEGGLSGAGIAGMGEGLAEIIEGDTPSPARIGVEAALGAVPFGKIITAGKPWVATARSGLFSGAGEGMREVAKGEPIDPSRIAKTAAVGAVAGNIFGRMGGTKTATESTGPSTSYEVEQNAVPGGRVLSPSGKGGDNLQNVPRNKVIQGTPEPIQPPNPRAAYWLKQGLNPPTAPGRMASPQFELPFDAAQVEEKVNIPFGESGSYPTGSALKSQKKEIETLHGAANRMTKAEQKATTEAAARKEIEDAIAQGLEPGPTTVSEGGSITTPSGRARYNRRWGAPKEGEEDAEVFDQPGPKPGKGRKAGTRKIQPDLPVAEPYSGGAGAEVELTEPNTLARMLGVGGDELPYSTGKGARVGFVEPKTPTLRQQAQQGSYEALQAKLETEGRGVAPPSPEVPLEAPEASGRAYQDVLAGRTQAAPPEVSDRRFNELLAKLGGRRVGDPPFTQAPSLEGGAVVEQAPLTQPELPEAFKPFVDGAAPPHPEMAEGPQSPMARLFKSRVDAAGQNYREIKAALAGGERVPEEGRKIAGKGLRDEAQAAGLPTGKAVQAPPIVVEEPPVVPGRSGVAVEEPPFVPQQPIDGLSQTQKAREAALAARKTKQQGLPGIDATTESQVSQAEQIANELKAQGATPEQIRKTLIERLGGEKGEISPEMLARLGMAGTGAFFGGIVGGAAGHPFIGAALGAGAGALSPDAISAGLRQIGVHPQDAEAAKDVVGNPEGVKDFAHKLFASLPQVQRFNLLSGFNLPANAWFGPYGSAMMAGLEAHLSGDPRGMEVLRKLNPERFMNEWQLAKEEAKHLIQEGEIGRAETQIVGKGHINDILQYPGVSMTAGDVAARKILEEAGFSPEEARRITMTAEPELDTPRKLANLTKNAPLLQMLMPFARTPANIAEQGSYRIPGLGFMTQSFREHPDSLRQQVVQQGLGLGAGVVGYEAGNNLDPEQKGWRSYLTNLAGQYSLPAGIGFAIGQAQQEGKPIGSTQTLGNLYNALPLPTTAPLASWGRAATTGSVPRGLVPSGLIDLGQQLGLVDKPKQAAPQGSRFIRRPRR